jgi:hypothetical protein
MLSSLTVILYTNAISTQVEKILLGSLRTICPLISIDICLRRLDKCYRCDNLMYFLYFFVKDWQIVLDCSPQHINVNAEILMNEHITYPFHLVPGNIWILFLDILRNVGCCFTYYLKITNNSINCFSVLFP